MAKKRGKNRVKTRRRRRSKEKEVVLTFGGRTPTMTPEERKWLARPLKKAEMKRIWNEAAKEQWVTCFEERKGWPSAPFRARLVKKEGNTIIATLKGQTFQFPAGVCSMEQERDEESTQDFLRRARLSLKAQVGKPFDPITGASL